LSKAAPDEAGALRIAVRVLSSGFKGNIKVSNMQAVRAPSEEAVAECLQIFKDVRQAEYPGDRRVSTRDKLTGEVRQAFFLTFEPRRSYCFRLLLRVLEGNVDYAAGQSTRTVAAKLVCAYLSRAVGTSTCFVKDKTLCVLFRA
jgi:hypothetical protein